MLQPLLDTIPVWLILAGYVMAMLVAYEVGFRVGRWWQDRTPDESEGPTGVLVGSLIALMAFLLAITMGMSSDRFDARRGLVLAEANAIGTTYLRAGYLPAPHGEQVRELLREYTDLRIVEAGGAHVQEDIDRSKEIHGELWSITETLVRTTLRDDLLGLFVESLNETIDLHESRVTAGLYARVPETVLLMLLAGSTLIIGVVGYSAGLTRRRSVVSAVVLIVALSVVTVLIVDLDRPRDGLLQVSQQPLIDLQESIGPPSP